jgi:hypothetical protein
MIVITFGLSNGNDYSQLKWAALWAVIAIAIIAVVGAVVATLLAKVPENTLKLGVGIILGILPNWRERADYFRHRLFTAEIRGMGCGGSGGTGIDFVDNHGVAQNTRSPVKSIKTISEPQES